MGLTAHLKSDASFNSRLRLRKARERGLLLGHPWHHDPVYAQQPHGSVSHDRYESMPLTGCRLDLLKTPAHSPEIQVSILGVTGWGSVLHVEVTGTRKTEVCS